jgi:GAF domain-containing protein
LDRDFNSSVERAARDLADEHTVEETLDRVIALCVEVIAPCELAGVSIVEDDRVRTLAASDELLRRIDDLQFELKEGPCYDAIRQHDVISSNDLATDDRWPTWGPLVSDKTGVHSSLSFRLFTTHRSLGALNLYSEVPASFGHEDVLEGHVVAAQAAVAVAATLKEAQLRRAVETRTVIGQATGILMERFGLDPDAAFGVMRRLSQTRNVKLYALARDLVETGHLYGLDHRPSQPEPF